MQSSNPTSGYISKGSELAISKKYLYFIVYCCLIHNSQNTGKKLKYPSTNE